jgi:hypothetical protein
MPLSKPTPVEDKEIFLSRCMDEMNNEFPDRKQRYAVCLVQWRER